jgi:hypothetical protein
LDHVNNLFSFIRFGLKIKVVEGFLVWASKPTTSVW